MEEAGVTPALGSTADPGSTAPPAAPATTAAPAATAGADAREPMEVDEGAVKEEEAGEPASAEATQASVQAPEDGSDAAPGEATGDAADDARIDAEFDALRQNAYKPLIPTMASVPGKDKELQEYKGLLQTVLSCLKSVLYTLVAFHSNRGLATPLSFPVEPWSSRPGDLAVVSRILAAGLPTLALYRAWPAAAAADMREQFADLFTVLQDGRDFCDVLAPRLPALFDAVAADAWYLPVVRHLVDGDQAARAGVNRHMVVALLRHLVGERLGALGEPGSAEGALAAQLLEACFEALPRMQAADAAKAAQVPPAPAAGGGIEDAVLPHVLAFTQHVYARLSLDGPDAEVHMRLLRSLFFALATGKFLKVQAAFGHTGLHVRVIDLTLGMMAGPTPSPAAGELCAELCLLAPARLEHLIPVMPRLAAALVTALKGSDRAASVALRVLDVWVDSFNPEFIEKSMAAHIRPLMQALWSLIRPPPAPFGARVAEILGKMGGRSRRWLLDPAQVAHKAIPEYGLRVILGFQAHTSFLVPLDRSMHYALGALAAGEPHLRAAALRLLHLCVATLARLRLPPAAAGDPRLAPRLLQLALFAPGAEPPALPADAHWPAELGVKTKKQHAAERAMLETLLVAAMTAPAVPDALQAEAAAFARGVARHFALLFAAGWGAQTPPPAPPSSRHERYAALGGVPAAIVGVVVPAGDGAVPGAQSGDAAAPTARATPADAAAASARAPSPPEMDVALPEDLRELLTEHLEFLGARGAVQSDLLVSCLCEVVQGVPAAANHLWGLLFPIVWTSLAKEQQTALAKPIIQLLSKEHHVRQVALRPTVGQTLLEGISMSQPQPKIPAEMIKYMGRHFHAWQTAISMLESHVTLFPQDMRCFDAVCELYRAVGEDDMVAGLWQRRAACEDTRLALALQQHGYLAQAQDKFLELMSRGVSTGVPGATKSEMVLWQRRYLDCCAELNQWDVVGEYAKATENSALSLEAGAHLHDWAHLRAAVLPRAQLEESAEVSMVRAQVALTEPMQEVDRLCKQALAQCVARWWQMPEASPWALAPVLHAFQRAVELPESWRIMMEFVRKGGPSQQYQELKDICETWKLRTPNEWEPVRWWSDLLTWRNQIHDTSITQLNNPQAIAANLHQMGYRDKAWSVNRLGLVARLHSQPDACCAIINTMYGFTAMEVQEAFVKVREQ
ncbi:hypothetical protein APUTEX25_003771, partial [Auxenochlorella protothecoides]